MASKLYTEDVYLLCFRAHIILNGWNNVTGRHREVPARIYSPCIALRDEILDRYPDDIADKIFDQCRIMVKAGIKLGTGAVSKKITDLQYDILGVIRIAMQEINYLIKTHNMSKNN